MATGIPGLANPDNTDQIGHGTRVAAMVAGNLIGVAKRASIVSVKSSDADVGNLNQLLAAWSFAVADIIRQGRKGKATINYSGGKSSGSLSSANLISVVGFDYEDIAIAYEGFNPDSFGYPIGDPLDLDPFLRLLKMAWVSHCRAFLSF